ncbi:cupin domain-containing protein [Vineibacter terrae]|uniref:Cupin domain-containing protein n=1 Tax=Vineibacter terrae TaxID=2586908 RepID=A0A5C8PNS7_9HYPH|nr:cupin domain-containing protein [Vineibacter terrae]TXL76410.1 cupin domain-containing protein [Vineibacter terrae]HEX2891965.1 cupin domain-containing protein [Vineibacter terrae]
MPQTRRLEPTDRTFASSSDIAPETITAVEGVREQGHLVVKKLLVGEEILMLEVFRGKGLIDPVHKHMDHESMGYLISGKLRLVIGGKELVAGPGTAWVHPVGVDHFSEALEECHQLEIKSPPMKTWT